MQRLLCRRFFRRNRCTVFRRVLHGNLLAVLTGFRLLRRYGLDSCNRRKIPQPVSYTHLDVYKRQAPKLCVLIENMEYEEPHQFGYDFIIGFRQMAEPAGFAVEVVSMTVPFQKKTPYDVFMLQNDYVGALVLGFSLTDPWMKDFETSHTPAVLFDNYIPANPFISSIGIDNNEGMELAVSCLKDVYKRQLYPLPFRLSQRKGPFHQIKSDFLFSLRSGTASYPLPFLQTGKTESLQMKPYISLCFLWYNKLPLYFLHTSWQFLLKWIPHLHDNAREVCPHI